MFPTYPDVAEPVHNSSAVDIRVQGHLQQKHSEDELIESVVSDIYSGPCMRPGTTYIDDSADVDERPAAATKRSVGKEGPCECDWNKYSGRDERH